MISILCFSTMMIVFDLNIVKTNKKQNKKLIVHKCIYETFYIIYKD